MAITIHDLGKLGSFFYDNHDYKMYEYLLKLKKIDWLRSNNILVCRTIREDGRILNSDEATPLTCAVIKKLGLPLSKEEQQKEKHIAEKMKNEL